MTNLRKDHINISILIIFEPILYTLGTEQFTLFRIPRMKRHIMHRTLLPYENLRWPSHNYLFSLFVLVLQLATIRVLLKFFFVFSSQSIIIFQLLLINCIKFHLNLAWSKYPFKIWLCIRIFLLNLNHYTRSQNIFLFLNLQLFFGRNLQIFRFHLVSCWEKCKIFD